MASSAGSARACRHYPRMPQPHPGWSRSLLSPGRDRRCGHSRHLSRTNRSARQDGKNLALPRGESLRTIRLRIGLWLRKPETGSGRSHPAGVPLRSRDRREAPRRRPAHARQCDSISRRSILSLARTSDWTSRSPSVVELVVETTTTRTKRGRGVKPVAFDYYRPQGVAEAVALLSDKGDSAAILAGRRRHDARADVEPESGSSARGDRHLTHRGPENHFGTRQRGGDWRRSDTERRTELRYNCAGGPATCNGIAVGGAFSDAQSWNTWR